MHPLLILVLVFDLLIAVSSVLNLVNMMRVNLMVEERRAEALTVYGCRRPPPGRAASWLPGTACTPARPRTAPASSPLQIPMAARPPCPLPPPWCPSRPPVCWSSATSPPTCAAALSRCGSRRLHSRLCWRLSSASEQALPPSRLFGTRLFPCGPLTHRLPGRGTMPGKYKYKGRQLWNY